MKHTADLHVVRHHADAPGPPVVLVPGSPDRSKNFAHVAHLLSDLPVTVYDRRGYGKSLAASADGGGFAVHADDLIDLLDGTPSVVVGQSAGGVVAMLAATKAPELFLAVGAWEPPMTPYDWWPRANYKMTMEWAASVDTAALGERFNRQILGDERWEHLAERTREMLRAEGAAFRADMACQERPYFELDHLKVPCVVGCGTVAYGIDATDTHHTTARALGAELLVVHGADHFAHISNPPGWVQLVRAAVALAQGPSSGYG